MRVKSIKQLPGKFINWSRDNWSHGKRKRVILSWLMIAGLPGALVPSPQSTTPSSQPSAAVSQPTPETAVSQPTPETAVSQPVSHKTLLSEIERLNEEMTNYPFWLLIEAPQENKQKLLVFSANVYCGTELGARFKTELESKDEPIALKMLSSTQEAAKEIDFDCSVIK